jgi:phosphonate degradation associated HDIG domain protein
MALTLEEISDLFVAKGAAQYGSEAVSQLQHALQCAHLAEQAGASVELVAAALVHDLGHLVAPDKKSSAAGVDDLHQHLAIPFLRGVFPESVLQPIGLHVDAKRYLCFADPLYHATLSPASQRSLVLQGGTFSEEDAAIFIAKPFAKDAVNLRLWDDLAKDPKAVTPGWDHYAELMGRANAALTPA